MNLISAHAQDVLRKISWAPFGVDHDGERSTMWLGTEGAHTPTHYDSYGSNLVAQLSGVKRWRLHPPSSDAPGLQPSRVPYEESSIFASEVDGGAGDDSAVSVDLQAGECLFVPKHWWHHVRTVSPYALSVNTWVDAEDDDDDWLKEAVARTVACALREQTRPITRIRVLTRRWPRRRERPAATAVAAVAHPTVEVWTHTQNVGGIEGALRAILGQRRGPRDFRAVTTADVVNALCTGRALEEAVAALRRRMETDRRGVADAVPATKRARTESPRRSSE